MKALKGKTVLITGASSGIGAALARELAKDTSEIVLIGRREDRLRSLVTELSQYGCDALASRCDVTRDGDLETAVADSIKKFKKIDVVIANAGFVVRGRFEKLSLEDYRRQFETNVFGVLRTLHATLDELKKTRGTFVLIGSVSGYISMPGVSAYSMSKAAIHALAHSLEGELKRFGIAVVLIVPGFVESEIRQVSNEGIYDRHFADPISAWLKMPAHKAAEQIVRAIGKKQTEKVITVHGKILVFIQRHFPWFLSFFASQGNVGSKLTSNIKAPPDSRN